MELHPDMHVEARQFDLRTAAGNERKTTGSYYTPDSLVQCLLDSALDPVVEDRLKGKRGKDAEQAILDMKVCDPACGSGHFLIAAAHRMARHLARLQTGEAEPSPEDHQHALRDVIGRCIYGVDINPMAVELCKVSLWMEAIEPGKPLSFLDHHIQCGNSLLGTTPRLLDEGIPDDAFKPIEGDVKKVCTELKADNKKQRKDREKGQGYLFEPYIKLGNLPAAFTKLSSTSDDSVADVAEKERRYTELVSGSDYQNARLLADTWCAVFVWQKDTSDLGKLCPTERNFRNIENSPHSILPHVKSEVRRLAGSRTDGGYHFFHWHLAFPDVFTLPGEGKAENEQTGWSGGFDVILGNPPWERVKLQEKEWFAERSTEIANAPNAAARKRLIDGLRTGNPELHAQFLDAVRQAEGESFLLRQSGRYPLCGRGDINVYTVFAETMRQILNPAGRAGCVLPSGIATDDTTKFFFQDVVETRSLVSLFDFENRDAIFPGVHRSYKFCLFTAGSGLRPACEQATFVFFAHQTEHVADPDRRFTLSPEDIGLLNPNTRTCPIFRSRRDAELTKAIYRRVPVLIREAQGHRPEENPWGIKFSTMFHMSNDSHLFRTREQLEADGWTLEGNVFRRAERMANGEPRMEEYLPLYEAKMIHQFEHRHSTLGGESDVHANQGNDVSDAQRADATFAVLPRYWCSSTSIHDAAPHFRWAFGFRDITRATDFRTSTVSAVPRCAISNKLPIYFDSMNEIGNEWCFLAVMNSFCLDFIARQKVGGISLNFYIAKQLAVPAPDAYSQPCPWSGSAASDNSPFATHHSPCSLSAFLLPRVLELTYTAWDLEPFARDCGYAGPPFRWDEERRFLLRAELDAAFFHLYGLNRDDTAYILDTFPIVRRKDIARTEIKNESGEVTTPGTYITKETILTIYDEMQQAIETGQPYQTKLNPPPGPPTDADGKFIPAAAWDTSHWPTHIHAPRQEAASQKG
ncbi:MAG: N-6 DNA methylase [Planctomycetota bacterium]|nr:N-6 DNA methylase [Planctomycetota bacterium]